MANYSPLHNLSPSSSNPIISPEGSSREEEDLVCSVKLTWPSSTPATPEAATSRIIKNVGYFGLYYTQFMWVVLFITLVPERKVSVIYMVITKEITLMYLLLLRAIPNSLLLHKIIDKRVVLLLLALITAVALIFTHAVIHLFASLAGTIPLVLLHAAFWKQESPSKNQDTAGQDLVQLLDNKTQRAHPSDSV